MRKNNLSYKSMSLKEKKELYKKFGSKYCNFTNDELKVESASLQVVYEKKAKFYSKFLLFSIVFGLIFVTTAVLTFILFFKSMDNDDVYFEPNYVFLALAIISAVLAMILLYTLAFIWQKKQLLSYEIEFLNDNIKNNEVFSTSQICHKSLFDKITDLKSYSFNEIITDGGAHFHKRGIYAFYTNEKYNKNDYYLPIYIGKAENIRSRWKQHANELLKAYDLDRSGSAKYQKIVNYLRHNNIPLESISYCVVEENAFDDLREREKEWMIKTGSLDRGWNSVK